MAGARDKVWFVTGCSTGMGRDIALEALAQGYRVVLTARNPDTLAELHARFPERSALRASTSPTARRSRRPCAARDEVFGRIDVLVNNAGYGYISAIEEGDEAEVRAMFETNFWGLLAVTRAVLPQMRERRSGQIINNSSQAGLMSYPGTAYYSTSKFAVEALSEGLRASSRRSDQGHGDRGRAVPHRLGRPLDEAQPDAARRLRRGRRRARPADLDMDGKQPGDPSAPPRRSWRSPSARIRRASSCSAAACSRPTARSSPR